MPETLLIKFIIKLFSWLPFSALYRLSGGLYLLILNVFGYRKKIVRANLERAFPEKSEEEREHLSREFYRYFCDLIVETLKGPTLQKEELLHRFRYLNPEIFSPLYQSGKSAILLGSHAGNWEWGVLSFPLVVSHKVAGIYKPLSNSRLNHFYNKLRRLWGLHLYSMKQAGRAILDNRGEACIFVLIADQTPSDLKNAHWCHFFHQDTAFLSGADKLARQTGYPVFLYEVQRVDRGYYEVTFRELCSNATEAPAGEITRVFAAELEAQIRRSPATWLWSHRRWKRKRTTPG